MTGESLCQLTLPQVSNLREGEIILLAKMPETDIIILIPL